MKQIMTTLMAFCLIVSTYAQSPEKFSYQAVVRDATDNLVVNTTTPIQVSIIEGSVGGQAVYVETHTPNTNANGLLTIEIGNGTVVSGAMNTINWGNNMYFIKTEIDVDNDASYDITGTSQLLSVPYALYAKTAASVNETQTLADVVALGNNANSQLKNVTNPTDPQDAVTKFYVDSLYTLLDDRITTLESQPAAVGDFRDGGIVIWVDPNDNTHGLVCALTDQSASTQWGCMGTLVPGTGTAVGTGASNTSAAVTLGCSNTGEAINLASNLTHNGYNDWFLPSLDELTEIYNNKTTIDAALLANGGTALSIRYWSSSQHTPSPSVVNSVWVKRIDTGYESPTSKNNPMPVRAIRAF